MNISLVSTYEGGMQPLGLATASAHLLSAGHRIKCWDSSITPPSPDDLSNCDIVGISVPLFESVSPAIELINQTRKLCSDVPIVLYGPYAMLNRDAFLARQVDAIVLGDWEGVLVEAAAHVAKHGNLNEANIPGLATKRQSTAPVYMRQGYMVPCRSVLPPLSKYSYPEVSKRLGKNVIVANVETTRGCRFACTYCSVFAAYNKKVTVFPENIVLDDVAHTAELGATHVCFADAEFLNAPAHALKIVTRMHQQYPGMTFDFTSRADLIAEDPRRIEHIVSCGGKFVTTAFEFPKQQVLDAINKQFTVDVLSRALEVCRDAGLGINPTFLFLNPWISFEDLQSFTQFLVENHLESDLEPIQLQTRLWLYKGSPLLNRPDVRSRIVSENPFNFEWQHSDPDVENVFRLMTESETTTGASVKRCCLKC